MKDSITPNHASMMDKKIIANLLKFIELYHGNSWNSDSGLMSDNKVKSVIMISQQSNSKWMDAISEISLHFDDSMEPV